MPETSTTPVLLAEAVEWMINQIVAGDRQLLQESLCRCARAAYLPTLWISRRLAGKLCFVQRHDKKGFWFFDWLTGNESDRTRVVADVRIRFALEPALDWAPAEVTDLVMDYVPPPFVLHPTEPGPLRLQLPEGHTLDLEYFRAEGGDLRLEVVRADGEQPAKKSKGDLLLRLLLAHPEFLRLLVILFAEWRQTGDAPGGPGYPLYLAPSAVSPPPEKEDAPSKRPVSAVLIEVKDQVLEILRACQPDGAPGGSPAGSTADPGSIHPLFSSGYALTQLQARALLQLNGKGMLITKPKEEDWHQVDILIRVLLDRSPRKIQVSYLLPDVLTSGHEYHELFVEALRREWKTLARAALPKPATPTHAAEVMTAKELDPTPLRAFFAPASVWEKAIVMRIDESDTDLVWFHGDMYGQRSELIFEADFEVGPYPVQKVKLKPKTVRFLVGTVPGVKLQDSGLSEDFVRFLHRQFTALYQWQELLQAPQPTPA